MSLIKIKKLKTCLNSLVNQTALFNAQALFRFSCFKGLNLLPCATCPICLHKILQSSWKPPKVFPKQVFHDQCIPAQCSLDCSIIWIQLVVTGPWSCKYTYTNTLSSTTTSSPTNSSNFNHIHAWGVMRLARFGKRDDL